MADPAKFVIVADGQFGILPSGHFAIFNASGLACDCCADSPCDPDWGNSKGPHSGTVFRPWPGGGSVLADQHKITVEAGADYYTSATITNGFNQAEDAPGTMGTGLLLEEDPATPGNAFAIIAGTTLIPGEYGIGFFFYPGGIGGAAVELFNSGVISFQPDGLWQIKVTPTTVHFTGSIYTYEYTRDPPDASRKCLVQSTLTVDSSADNNETSMDWANFWLQTPIPEGL